MQLPFDEAETLQKSYVCATCWGPLIAVPVKGENHNTHLDARCANPDCTGEGFVTHSYADGARAKSAAEYAEARYILGPLFGLEEKKSTEQILHELGY